MSRGRRRRPAENGGSDSGPGTSAPGPRQLRWQMWSRSVVLLLGGTVFLWASWRVLAGGMMLDAEATRIGVLGAVIATIGLVFIVQAAASFWRGLGRTGSDRALRPEA